MKLTIFLFAFVLLFNFCFSQNLPKEIPKGTSKIIIETNQGAEENYKKALMILLENDFEIEKRDSELLTMKTGLKSYDKTGQYYLNLRCKEQSIVVTGKFCLGISVEVYGVQSEDTYESIINKGMKGSPLKKSFAEMYKVALLQGGNLEYH